MIEKIEKYLQQHRDDAYILLRRYAHLAKEFLLRSELLAELEAYAQEGDNEHLLTSPLADVIGVAQEAVLDSQGICLAVRPRIGRWQYLRFHLESVRVEEISITDYLSFKERLRRSAQGDEGWPLEVDITPFNREFPKLKETRSIGQGVSFLNRKLSSELFANLDKGDHRLLEFMRMHQIRGSQLLLNDQFENVDQLRTSLRQAEGFLENQPLDATWSQVAGFLQPLGFEPGWGRTVDRVLETFRLLSDILEAPAPATLERFLSRIPSIFSIVILSPHGYFGQSNVLGLPDTGGQVVYILDQVRALEREMKRRLYEEGVDIEPKILVVTRLIPEAGSTNCDEPVEKIAGTENASILRIPFREEGGEIVPAWISRFKVWPYLERFALETERAVKAELGGRPALIIGNYSDGNLVASLLSRRMQVTQCNIAHALEKTKYLRSDLDWKELEGRYGFGCQFTADLISMNMADFIVTSTYQEIAGTADTIGQYESYSSFTMPGLYRVVSGVSVFDPKFNVVSPGADPDVYFSYTDADRRLKGLHPELNTLVFGDFEGSKVRGRYANQEKPIIFTMARLDRIKNLSGLVDWYGRSPRLREAANLLIIGGDLTSSKEPEENEQIQRMHELIDQHGLEPHIRWIGFQAERNLAGELYRFIADHRGVFIQPALFEAYGLTVIEAMSSGLPTFATCHGGPLEIIEDGVSGFHVDPYRGDEAAEQIVSFFERCQEEPGYWERISEQALARIADRYTWKRYAQRMMTISRVYGFWKFVTNLEREETYRYFEMFYSLQFRRLCEEVPFDGQPLLPRTRHPMTNVPE